MLFASRTDEDAVSVVLEGIDYTPWHSITLMYTILSRGERGIAQRKNTRTKRRLPINYTSYLSNETYSTIGIKSMKR